MGRRVVPRMDLGEYPKYAIVTLAGLLLFFLGASLPFQPNTAALVSLFAMVMLTVAMSYGNRSPSGGFFLGVFASITFLLGFFVMTCVWELYQPFSVTPSPFQPGEHPYIIGPVGFSEGSLDLLTRILSSYGPQMLSAVFAFASIGLFFGTFGYVSSRISLHASTTQPRIFRDYWSSVLQLGKSEKREFDSFDRKLSTWSFRKREWWKRILERITEPQADLIFVPQKKKTPELGKGDLFDLSSGRMIGDGLADPSDLASRFRPSVLKVAELSSDPKGVRRVALENLLAKFLKRVMFSRGIWGIYILLSAVLIYAVNSVWASKLAAQATQLAGSFHLISDGENRGVFYDLIALSNGTNAQVTIYPAAVASALVASAMTLFFVWRWRKASRELFVRRPDERVLIFFVYIILALLFGFYYEVMVNPPAIPENWVGAWFVWTRWLVALTVLLGVGYICIHRECEVVNMYFYDNRPSTPSLSRVAPFKESDEEPFWLKEEGVKAYWVLRFMYFWRYELTTVPHSDWERVEVWIDAENGAVRWIVSDYHYRELWYKVEGNLPLIYVRFFMNFHTPIPIVDSDEAGLISGIFAQEARRLVRIATSGKASEVVEQLRSFEASDEAKQDVHSASWIQSYGLPRMAAEFCSKLDWTYWRYPHGLDKPERYVESPAATVEDQPKIRVGSHEPDQSFCGQCGTTLAAGAKFCTNCGKKTP